MKVIDDGVIKYDRSNFSYSAPLSPEEFQDLEYWRKKLFILNLIGVYEEADIGFGNISEKRDYSHFFQGIHPQFIITGTQTGKYRDLDGSQYTRVLDYKIDELKISVMGPIEASSEALTHATIYDTNKNIECVFHLHSSNMWEKMILDQSDFTPKDVPYGTVEMAHSTKRCIAGKESGFFCMHGHADGIVIYGTSLDEVGKMALDLYYHYL